MSKGSCDSRLLYEDTGLLWSMLLYGNCCGGGSCSCGHEGCGDDGYSLAIIVGFKSNDFALTSLLALFVFSHNLIRRNCANVHENVIGSRITVTLSVITTIMLTHGLDEVVFDAPHSFGEQESKKIISCTNVLKYHFSYCNLMMVIGLRCRDRGEENICGFNSMSIPLSCGGFSIITDFIVGKALHAFCVKGVIHLGTFQANTLISMYSKFGSIEHAQHVFDKMPERNEASWNNLMSGFVRVGWYHKAMQFFCHMLEHGVRPSSYVAASLVTALLHFYDKMLGYQVLGSVIKSGLDTTVSVANSLISMFGNCDSIEEASCVFDDMKERDTISWNSIITASVHNGHCEKSLEYFSQMLKSGLESNATNYVTFTTALSACYNLETLKIVHAFVILLGLHHNLIIGNALVTMYGKFGSMAAAQRVCKIMPDRDEVTWNALIGGHADNKEPNAAIEAFNLLREEGVPVNYITIVNLLSAFLSPDDLLDHGMPIHAHIVVAGFELETFVQSSLITMYAQCGDLNTSNYIFDVLANKNSSTWNAILSANAHYGPGEEALKLIIKMRNDGIHLDQFSFSVAHAIIGNLTLLDEGQQLHSLIIKHGFESNDYVLNATMDMYGKCGEIDDVFRILPQPRSRSQRSWNILISALARHGFFQQAREAFHEMLDLGLRPDHVTFVSLLSACSHGGLVDEGLAYFSSMSTKFGVPTGIEHCVCIIDLLGRAGKLTEAENFINKMPVPPTDLVWRSLLAACKIHGNLELARKAADRLFELDSSDDSAYVLYSNVCASTRRWRDVENVRKQMESHNIKKKPACSWVKLKNQVTTFGMGDQYHPQNAEIYAKLEELKKIIREAGYMPDTSYSLQDTDEEQKEHNLWNHSERIALAFGLINSSEGSPLRIFKNLRVCGDCHSVFKMVSQIIGRKIILRDAYRFHHFSSGKCSCSDYW
ncbi:hypothetical protein JHK87_033792 [Glycine soja]|nr:hypothetical protein JHK87_033792 [Glycine soja]